jgi:drug/metabolite transporter (DMT)-like permease
MNRVRESQALLSMLLAVCFWSLNPVAMKMALMSSSIFVLAAFRVVAAALLLWGFVWLWSRQFRWKDLGVQPFLMGILEPGINSFLFLWAMTLVSVPNVILFSCMMPFAQSLLGYWVLKEPLEKPVWLGGVLGLLGMLIFLKEQTFDWSLGLGNAVLLLAYGLTGVNQLLTRRVMLEQRPLFLTTSCQMTVAAVVTLLVLGVSGEWTQPPQVSTSGDWFLLFYLAGSIGLPFLLYNRALREVSMGLASLMIILTVPLGFFFSWLLLQEEMTSSHLLGAALVAGGVILPQLTKIRARPIPA